MSLWGDKMNSSTYPGNQENHPGKKLKNENYYTEEISTVVNWKDPESGAQINKRKQWNLTDDKPVQFGVLSKNYLRKFSTYLRSSTSSKSSDNMLRKNTFTIGIPHDGCEIHENFNTSFVTNNKPISILNHNYLNVVDNNSLSDDSSKDISVNKCDKIDDVQNNQISDENCEIKNVTVNPVGVSIVGVTPGHDENITFGSFLLPRVILKQSSVTATSSTTAEIATTSTTTTTTSTSITTNTIINDDDTGFERCFNDKTERERITLSNYSTEKSGSSGYYSSNLYSTSSVDEHIYSEPVIDCIQSTTILPQITAGRERRSITNHHLQQQQQQQQKQILSNDEIIYDDEEIYIKRKNDKLPTIMEGIDGQIPVPRPVWPTDFDDSLIDINLESFLLTNDTITYDKNNKKEKIEIHNNNSLQQQTDNNVPNNPDKSLSIYLNKYEDNLNIQHTRDILEDIREKLNNLLEEQLDTINDVGTNPFIINENYQNSTARETEIITTINSNNKKIDLEKEIKNLKNDLDNYLKMINHENEIEIKQLCNGLSKNTKMLTIKKALENKTRSIGSNDDHHYRDDDYEIFQYQNETGYEKMMPFYNHNNNKRNLTNYKEIDLTSNFDTVYIQDGFNINENPFNKQQQQQQQSINSVADNNFHFKKKLTNNNNNNNMNNHYNNIVEFSDESEHNSLNININNDNNNSEKLMIVSNHNQLQQNLSLHRPTLLVDSLNKSLNGGDKDMILEWHKNKPSIWELYYGANRPHHTFVQKIRVVNSKKKKKKTLQSVVSYPSTRPESDFTLDLPRAEQLRTKMKQEKQFRSRCRILMTFFSLIFFLLTVMVVSLILTRGQRMFGSLS